MPAQLSTLLSQVLLALTIECDNEFEQRFRPTGLKARIVSYAIWSNLIGFVESGETVDELIQAAGLEKANARSLLGGVERWGYLNLGPRSENIRDGYGSGRGIRGHWSIQLTEAGMTAAEIWAGLAAELDRAWLRRFASVGLSLESVGVDLPAFLPVMTSSNGFRLELPHPRSTGRASTLIASVAQPLMAYALEWERRAPIAITLFENVIRLLSEEPTPVSSLAESSGVSKEAIAMAMSSLARTIFVEFEGKTASVRTIRLTQAGLDLADQGRRSHTGLEKGWPEAEALKESSTRLLEHPETAVGLKPYPTGWRAQPRHQAHTERVQADARSHLAHFPMVLPRGGWPDGS